jgi:hypothetical protein
VPVWFDEFDGYELDTSKWSYRLGTRGSGTNVQDAISIAGGFLTITTYTDEAGNDKTGMIQTGGYDFDNLQPPGSMNKYMPLYGYIEASIKFEDSPGMWSSFWLQTPKNADQAQELEQDRGAELDIVEHQVEKMINGVLTNVSAQAPSALHFMSYPSEFYCGCPDDPRNFWHGGGAPHSGTGSLADGQFHTYGLEWAPDYLRFLYDGNLVWTIYNSTEQHPLCDKTLLPGTPGSCWVGPCPGQDVSQCVVGPVPHTNEFILLNPEVSSKVDAYGPRPTGGYGPLTGENPSTTKMTVDYVRHYQLLVAPSSLTAAAQSTGQINLAWTYNTYFSPDGFKIERSTDNVNFNVVATVAADVHTYQDTGLIADTRYWYRVRAYIGANYSSYSNKANTITDVTPPAAVMTLSLPSHGNHTIAVSWTAPEDDGTGQSVFTYDLRYSRNPITASNYASATRFGVGAPHVSGYPECRVVTGLTACTTYFFAIKSMDEAGNVSEISNVPSAVTECQNATAQCSPLQTDSTAPAAVTDLSVTCVGNTTMSLAWTAPGDDGTTGTATEYDFRYSTSTITASNFASATHFPISVPSGAGSVDSRVVTGLLACHAYFFALKTRDEWGNWSGISNVASGSTVCGNQIPPCDGEGAAKLSVPTNEAPQVFSAPRPNPARGSTSFQIMVPGRSQGAKLRVAVFDVAGRRVRLLVNRTALPGPAQIEWNLRDDSGHRVASGLYLMRVEIGDTRKTFRLAILR